VAQLTPQQNRLTIPRGKATGGSSAVNGQVLYRGIPEDYDNWASWGNTEWSYEQVLPYFRKMENDHDFGGEFHGKAGPVPVLRYTRDEWMPQALAFHRACVDADFRDDPDQNHPESTGVSARARNTIDGVRISMAIAYLDPARHRLNLTIKGNIMVRRLLFDGKRAVGVEVAVAALYGGRRADRVERGAVAHPTCSLSGVGPGPSSRVGAGGPRSPGRGPEPA
jgi:choline dehydrogenase